MKVINTKKTIMSEEKDFEVRFISRIPKLTVILKSAMRIADNAKGGMEQYIPGQKAVFKVGPITYKTHAPTVNTATLSGVDCRVFRSQYVARDKEIAQMLIDKRSEMIKRGMMPTYIIHPDDEGLMDPVGPAVGTTKEDNIDLAELSNGGLDKLAAELGVKPYRKNWNKDQKMDAIEAFHAANTKDDPLETEKEDTEENVPDHSELPDSEPQPLPKGLE